MQPSYIHHRRPAHAGRQHPRYSAFTRPHTHADVRKKYGSRGVAQAKKIKEQTTALFAGGELSEEDQAAFIKEMEALFLDAKADAKKFTPKKYLQ